MCTATYLLVTPSHVNNRYTAQHIHIHIYTAKHSSFVFFPFANPLQFRSSVSGFRVTDSIPIETELFRNPPAFVFFFSLNILDRLTFL